MITDFLHEGTVQLQLKAENRDQAIALSAAPLVERKKIEESYIQRMQQAVEDMGPYMVILPGIALAHAKPGEDVLEECLSLATFSTPVVFGHKKNDPVKAVFTLASPAKDTHLQVLLSVSKLLTRPEFLEMLFTTSNVAELLEYIEREEE